MTPETDLRTMIDKALARHPSTVRDLALQIQAGTAVNEVDFVDAVKGMVGDGTLALGPPSYEIETVLDYLFTITQSAWYWAVIGATALSLIIVGVTPDTFPLVVPRWVFGSIFVLFLPGYAFLELLFPLGRELDSLERFALNIGVSLAVVPLIGLVLNFTPWGIRLIPIVTSLASFTILAASAAVIRKYWSIRTQIE